MRDAARSWRRCRSASAAARRVEGADQAATRRQDRPGIFSPPRSPDMDCPSCSSTLRLASFTAAAIRSCSISTSSFDTTSGSILIDCTCLAPLTTTVTMPPPAEASTRRSLMRFCSCSCICLACCITSRMFIVFVLLSTGCCLQGSLRSHLFDVADLGREDVEHGLNTRRRARLFFQITFGRGGGGGRRAHISGRCGVRLHLRGRHLNAPAGQTMCDALEPLTVRIELHLCNVLIRRECERDAIVGDVDTLRLCDGQAVQSVLPRPNLREESVFESSRCRRVTCRCERVACRCKRVAGRCKLATCRCNDVSCRCGGVTCRCELAARRCKFATRRCELAACRCGHAARGCAPAATFQEFHERHQLAQVHPPQQQHLDVIAWM